MQGQHEVQGGYAPTPSDDEGAGASFVFMTQRPARAFTPGEPLVCAKCGRPGLVVGQWLLRCEAKVGQGTTRRRCNGHHYLLSHGGITALVHLSPDEADQVTASLEPEREMWRLGLPDAAFAAIASARRAA